MTEFVTIEEQRAFEAERQRQRTAEREARLQAMLNLYFQNGKEFQAKTPIDNPYNRGILIATLRGDAYQRRAINLDLIDEVVSQLGDAADNGALSYPPKTIVIKEVIKEAPAKKARPMVQVQSSSFESHADRMDREAREQQAKIDYQRKLGTVDSPEFKATQARAAAEYKAICSRPQAGRNHALNARRKQELEAIRVVARQRDVNGDEVILWTECLLKAQALQKKWEKESSRSR